MNSDKITALCERLTVDTCEDRDGNTITKSHVELIHERHQAATTLAALNAKCAELTEALGAHIQADAYRDTFPDNEEDARQLRKSETWWRLTARSWTGEDLASECAQAAKAKVIASPEHQAILSEVRTALKDKSHG